MPCKLIRLEPNAKKTIEKIKNEQHGDLVFGKNINQSGLYVVYNIDTKCNLIPCDTGEYFPRTCNIIPTNVTKYIKNPYKHYKKYFTYIQEINLDPESHHNIILQYTMPNLNKKYKFDINSFYVTHENEFTDSYDIKTFELKKSNIPPFIGY